MNHNILNEKDAADYIGLAAITLRMQRARGTRTGGVPPIPYVRLGRAIRYRVSDLDRYLEEHLVGGPA